MENERIRKIESDIELSGGFDQYVSETHNNPEKVSDLSFYINQSIKTRVSDCDKCELSDINTLLDSLYPIISNEDAQKIVESRESGNTLNKSELDSYLSLEDIKNGITSIPNSCISCFKEKSSNTKLNDSRTCENTYGISGIPEGESQFTCPDGYSNKSDLSLINCPDQNNCNKELCCDVKDEKYYLSFIFPALMLFCIIIFIMTLVGYVLKGKQSNYQEIVIK